jgi:hypothetical protein
MTDDGASEGNSMSRLLILKTAPVAIVLAVTIAGPGHAQTPMSAVPKTPAFSQVEPGSVVLDLSTPGALSYARHAPTPLPRGIARTSVEHQDSDFTGSAGLLCGIQPSADTSGAAMARGYDPDGKFVGAKLALRF